MIPFINRFHGHNSLNYVYRNGNAWRSRLFTIKYISNPHRKMSRVAVVVGKKVLKSAVRRNRIRRKIYESIHCHLKHFNSVTDVVIIVTSAEVFSTPKEIIDQQINEALKEANVL